MIEPDTPGDELQRQLALDRLGILNTDPECSFDDITALLSYLSGAPITLVALLDRERNWFKSHYGTELTESPRAISFCGHTINDKNGIMIVEDARLDRRFHDNPLVKEYGAIFYAGVPLLTPEGYKVGTLCLFDTVPRALSEDTQKALKVLANQVVSLLELRYQNQQLTDARQELQSRNDELAQFARTVAHDLKSPISSIVYSAELLKLDVKEQTESVLLRQLDELEGSARSMARYIDELLRTATRERRSSANLEIVNLAELVEEIRRLVVVADDVDLSTDFGNVTLQINRASLLQILLNLITNAIKYCDKARVEIQLTFTQSATDYTFCVKDNGIGFPQEDLDLVFSRGRVADVADRRGNYGSGYGLKMISHLIEKAGGSIKVQSIPGLGSTFTFSLLKEQEMDVEPHSDQASDRPEKL